MQSECNTKLLPTSLKTSHTHIGHSHLLYKHAKKMMAGTKFQRDSGDEVVSDDCDDDDDDDDDDD